jgi:hypothetical protein
VYFELKQSDGKSAPYVVNHLNAKLFASVKADRLDSFLCPTLTVLPSLSLMHPKSFAVCEKPWPFIARASVAAHSM